MLGSTMLEPGIPNPPRPVQPVSFSFSTPITSTMSCTPAATAYTAFLATEGTDLADFNGLVVGCRNELESKAVQTRSGRGALNQGLNFNRQKGQAALNYRNRFVDEHLNRVEITTVEQRCDLAFFRRGRRWIDSRLISVHQWMQPHEVLIIGSPQHTRLLRRLAGEGRQGVLSLSGEILLEVDGRAVLVKDGC